MIRKAWFLIEFDFKSVLPALKSAQFHDKMVVQLVMVQSTWVRGSAVGEGAYYGLHLTRSFLDRIPRADLLNISSLRVDDLVSGSSAKDVICLRLEIDRPP